MPYKGTNANHYRGKMGQNKTFELNKEEEEDLSVGLLRSWWLEATETLVDIVGSEEALSLLKPYYQHGGMASRRVFQSITNLDLDGGTTARMGFRAHTSWLRGEISTSYRASDGSEISERHGCATSGICKEACDSVCSIIPFYWEKEMNPDWEIRLIRSLSWGDSCCQWKVWRSETSPKVEAIKEMRVAPDLVFRDPLDDDTWKSLGLAYAGESWVLASRAIIDSSEQVSGIEELQHRLRLYGVSVGLRLKVRTLDYNGAIAIYDIFKLISDLHQRKGDITLQEDGASGTVSECPFAGSAPPEICMQYEAFFNGICEAIDPSYEFAYDRMMTKGDKTCHWMIRKKGELAKEKANEAPSLDGPIERLTNKYIDGEITEEEFRKKLSVLKELKL